MVSAGFVTDPAFDEDFNENTRPIASAKTMVVAGTNNHLKVVVAQPDEKTG